MPRFTHDPRLFGGKATLRGMRLTVAAFEPVKVLVDMAAATMRAKGPAPL